MATVLERPRRNLFLQKIFIHDCLSLDLNDSGESDDAEDIDTLQTVTLPATDDDSEEFIDDLEDIDIIQDSGTIQDDIIHDSPIIHNSDDDNDDTLPNLYGHYVRTANNEYDHSVSDYIEQYDIIPRWFVNIETWPRSTNLDCWYCDCKNPGMPWFIPVTEIRKCIPCDPATGKILPEHTMDVSDAALLNLNSNKRYREVEAMKTLGHFCSICCAKTYLSKVADSRIINKWQSNKLLKKLYKLATGDTISDIPEATTKTVMIQYCGPVDGITPKEYRIGNERRLEEYLNSRT